MKFDTFWYSKAEAEFIKSKHSSSTDFVSAIIEGSTFILERLYDCTVTGSWNPIIHSGHAYGRWVDEVYALKEMSQKLHNPEANGISYHAFLGRLDSAIEQGESIIKYAAEVDSTTKTMLKRLVSDIRLIKANECTKVAARQQRETPFAILYFGGSSIGKSTLTDLCYHYFAKLHNLPEGDEYTYTRSFSDEYWSGFQTSAWSIVLDDVAARKPDSCQDDKSISEILQIINQVAFTPPQADLADKGRTPLRPKLVQASTNTKNLMAHAWYNNQLAILRRFPIVVTPIVKPEYCVLKNDRVPDEMDRQLDNSRCPPIKPGEYPDFWEFRVERVVSETQGEGENLRQYVRYAPFWQDVDKITSIYEFLARVGKESLAHAQRQKKVMDSSKLYSQLAICDKCYYPVTQCCCIALQSVEVTTAVWNTSFLMMLWICWSFWPQITQHMRHQVRKALRGAVHLGIEMMKDSVNDKVEAVKRDSLNLLERVDAAVQTSLLTGKERLQYEAKLVREHLVTVGQKVRAARTQHKLLLAFLTAAPLLLGAAYVWKQYHSFEMQGASDVGGRPTARDEKENPWYRDDYAPSTFEVGKLTASWKALSREQVSAKVQKNVLYATAHYMRDGLPKMRAMRLLCVGGQVYVTNNHNIPQLDVKLRIKAGPQVEGIGSNFEFALGMKDTYRMIDKDLVFFRIGCMPPKANIMELIPRDNFKGTFNGDLVGRTPEGESHVRPVQAVKYLPSFYTKELERYFQSWSYWSKDSTVSGDCGTVLVGYAPTGPAILGLHQTGGKGCQLTAVKLTREDVESCLTHFQISIIQSGHPELVDNVGGELSLKPLHGKSVFRYITGGTANVYGSLPGFRASHKSSVCPTLIAPVMQEAGYPIKTGAPVMKGWEPWRHAAVDVVQQQFEAHQSTIDKCAEGFASEILARLDVSQLEELQVFDNATTLNGYPGTKFIDKMNRSTSMGFPYRQKKTKYLKYLGQHDVWDDYVEFHDGFYERVDRIIETYQSGKRYMPVFIGHLKDEPLKQSKIDEKKTRVFSSGPAEWCFVVRKYLLSFVRVVQNNKYLFESGPGTNATSAEWEQMYNYLTQFGTERIIAGDYSKFDKRMSAQWIIAAFRVIRRILEAAGWEEKDLIIIDCIGYDIAFPLTDFNGDLVEFWGSNPSGHPLTVIVNGLVNALLMRYAWHETGHELTAFKKHVALITYGDDNTMGVNEDTDNFDHTIIAAEMQKIGVVYTMADKEAESVPFLNISQVSFLKRSWRFEPELQQHVAQLEHDSIAKMLTMHLPSKVVCAEQHAVDVMGTALREYFFYGREKFEDRRRFFLNTITRLDLGHFYTQEYPTFDELKADYIANSSGVDVHKF
uniref:Nonstructural polyprotein n=1 Tax=Biomphalaria pfeifferi virus 3 TaxID=2884321 RepID=A0A8K1P8A2_9VIRU|nr:MAG: nonstructural polyprotein [Biomphalaria pfeifferi virus 3]